MTDFPLLGARAISIVSVPVATRVNALSTYKRLDLSTQQSIGSPYRSRSQAKPTSHSRDWCILTVEVRNIHRTFYRTKVNSERLEDEGAPKEPLPFLMRVVVR